MSITEVDKIHENFIETKYQEFEKVINKSPTFSCSIISKGNEKTLATFKKLTRTWDDIAADRTGKIRQLYLEKPTKEIKDKELEDVQSVKVYKLPTSMFRDDIGKMTSKSKNKEEEEYKLLILSDKNNQVQAMGSIAIRSDEIYINTLFTAPWNLEMHGCIEEDHKSLVTRGAGTAFIRATYELAQKNNKSQITLKPTNQSQGFYQKMGMTFNEEGLKKFHFKYDVNQFSIPKKLDERTNGIVKFA